MTTWWGWVRRRASASRVLVATQLLLVIVTTGIIAGTLGWTSASATTAARAALTLGETDVTSIRVQMRQAPDTAAQDTAARAALVAGFSPAPVSITHELVDDTGGGTGFAVWTIAPDVEQILPEHLDTLAAGAEEARRLVEEADVTGRGITHSGDLAPTAAAAASSWSAAAALGFVPLSVLVLVTVLGVTQVAGLLASARESEVHLMLARGARGLQLVAAEITESSVVTAVGTVIGTLGALGILELLGTAFTARGDVVTGGLATGGLIVATLAVTTGLQVRRTTRAAATSDRVRAVAGAGAATIVGALAAVALWQLWRTGTVVARGSDGAASTDRLAASATALLLLAAAVAGLVVIGPLSRLLERLLHAGSGIAGALAGSQVSRRLSVQAVPVVLTILATSTTTLAAFFAGSATALDQDLAQLARGADLRAVVTVPASPPTVPAAAPAVSEVPGVEAHAPVWLSDSARLGDAVLSALVGPHELLDDVVQAPRGLTLPDLAAAVPPPDAPRPLVVPAGTSMLELDLTAQVFLNPWQQQAFDLIDEFSETEVQGPQYDGIPQESLEELAQMTAARFRDGATGTVTVQPQLLLRDVRTGVAALVRGTDLVLQPAVDGLGEDPMAPVFVPATGQTASRFALDPQSPIVVDSIVVELSSSSQTYQLHGRTVDVTATLTGDGTPLLGAATQDWTSPNAVPLHLADEYLAAAEAGEPVVEVVHENYDGQSVVHLDSNEPAVPQLVDVTGPELRLTGVATHGRETVRIAPGLTVSPDVDWLGVADHLTPTPVEPLRVALTTSAAERSTLRVGDRFDLGILQWTVPAVLDSTITAVPGITAQDAVFVDSTALGAHLATLSTVMPWPTQVWAAADDPEAAAAGVAALTGVTDVLAAPSRTATPVSSTAFTFQVAAAGATLLALVGIAAAGLTQLSVRRPEVATLRAIGVPARSQALSRVIESGITLVPAVGLGMAAGWLVSGLVVPHLAASAVLTGGGLPAELHFDPTAWLVLLGVAAGVVALATLASARVVRAQAQDRTYREEVR